VLFQPEADLLEEGGFAVAGIAKEEDGVRRLRVLRFSPSLDGGLPLLWLSLASRASKSRTRPSRIVTCSRSPGSSLTWARTAAFAASNSAIRASDVMPVAYTCCASPPDLLP
jgi:hypothetical protein